MSRCSEFPRVNPLHLRFLQAASPDFTAAGKSLPSTFCTKDDALIQCDRNSDTLMKYSSNQVTFHCNGLCVKVEAVDKL